MGVCRKFGTNCLASPPAHRIVGMEIDVHRNPSFDTSAASTSSPSGLTPRSIQGDEVVECLLARLAVEGAVPAPPDRALHEQV